MPQDWNIIVDEPDPVAPPEPDDRINLLRVRAIVNERRAAYRRLFWSRAIVLIFACATVVMAIDASRVPRSQALWYAIAAAVFAVLTFRAAMRIPRFRLPALVDADVPTPSREAFDQLSNGDQFSRSLDELSDRPV